MNTKETLRAVATNQVQRQPKTIFDYLDDPRVKNGLAAVAGKFMTPERMLKVFVYAVKKNPLLLKCDPQSVLGAMMTTAALGLEPNTVQQLAFLIPYGNNRKVGNEWKKVYECQFQIGARGFVTLAYRSPLIKSLHAEAIHENDLWQHMEGTESFLKYSKALKDRGDLIGSFSYARLTSGAETACVLPLEEIHKIRAKSEAWRSLNALVDRAENDKERARAQQKLIETPWLAWEDDMAAKSATKKHAKQLPISSSDLLIAASEVDNAGEMGKLDLKTLADPDAVRAVIGGEMDAPVLENNPSETLDDDPFSAPQSERVQVMVDGPASTGGHAVIDPADRPDTGAESSEQEQPQRQDEREHPMAQAAVAGAQRGARRVDSTPKVTYAKLADRITKADGRDIVDLILDEGRALPPDQREELNRLANEKFPPDA